MSPLIYPACGIFNLKVDTDAPNGMIISKMIDEKSITSLENGTTILQESWLCYHNKYAHVLRYIKCSMLVNLIALVQGSA
jgi:hypothetical protein